MYKLRVNAEKLNLRSSPFADDTYTNWVGDMNKGEVFHAESLVVGKSYNNSDLWYKDHNNNYATLTGFGDDDPKIPWSLKLLGIPHVWNVTKGESVKVAIIDSGIDLNNNDLNDRSLLINEYNVLNNSTDVQDTFFHGNFCASILASRGIKNLYGVAPSCEIIVIKIANTRRDYNNTNELLGLRKAVELGAEVISLSLGSVTEDSTITSFLEDVMDAGIICIAAAGDNNKEPNVEYPANIKGMISVGNVSCLNKEAHLGEAIFQISNKSNGQNSGIENEGVTIVAPGEEICVYDLQQQVQSLTLGNGGTSWSVPYVAGVAALWLSLKKKGVKVNYHQSFRNFLATSARKNFPNYDPKFWGFGVINPLAILQL